MSRWLIKFYERDHWETDGLAQCYALKVVYQHLMDAAKGCDDQITEAHAIVRRAGLNLQLTRGLSERFLVMFMSTTDLLNLGD